MVPTIFPLEWQHVQKFTFFKNNIATRKKLQYGLKLFYFNLFSSTTL